MKKPDVIRTPRLVLKALADGDRGPIPAPVRGYADQENLHAAGF